MNIHPLQAIYADHTMIASPDTFYASVKEEFMDYLKSGFYLKTPHEAIYICQIKTPSRTHLGIMSCVDINDYSEGKILKHENTLAEKEQKMMNMILQRHTMIKPVLLAYPPVPELQQFMHEYRDKKKPLFEVKFAESGERHTIWEVKEGSEIKALKNIFAYKVPQCYIADGHHRCSTADYLHRSMKGKKHLDGYDMLFAAFFDFDELQILDYNRVVDIFSDISPMRFMAGLSEKFHIKAIAEARKPMHKFEIIMMAGREAFSMIWKKEILDLYKDEVACLDAHLLDLHVFQEILGIKDVRVDKRIDYVEGVKGLEGILNKVYKNPNMAGFSLYPVDIEEVVKISDAGQIMPPKSTWFEPRMKNGLLAYRF